MEVIIGVVTGVVTSGLLWLLRSLWTNHVEPYMVKLRYQGVDIAGQWTALFITDESATRFVLNLIQEGHFLKGSASLEFYSANNEYRIFHTASGELWEGYVSLRFKPVDRKITSYSVVLLKVAGGGVGLVGTHLYRDVNEENVDHMEITYSRGSGSPSNVIKFNEAAAKFQAHNLALLIQGEVPSTPKDAGPKEDVGLAGKVAE